MKLKALNPYTNRQATPLGVLRHDGAYNIVAEAHGHRNAETAALIEKAVNEHAALVEVAEAAHGLMMTPGVEKFDVAHYKVAKAISNLTAVRAGQVPEDNFTDRDWQEMGRKSGKGGAK